MTQILFGPNTAPTEPNLDLNFTQLYELRELITTPGYTAATPKVVIETSTSAFMVNTLTSGSNLGGVALLPYAGGVIGSFGHTTSAAGGDTYVGFLRNAVTIGSITQVSSTGVAYNTTSDRRLKSNFREFAFDAGHVLRKTVPCSYDWRASGEAGHGYIAQELYRHFAPAVTKGRGRGKSATPWQVDNSKMVPVLHVRLVEVGDELAALRRDLKAALVRIAKLEAA